MASEGRRQGRATLITYPLIGVLAVGNAVFALLWLLSLLGGGGGEAAGGRRIEVASRERRLTVAEGAEGLALAAEVRLKGEEFAVLVKALARLAQSKQGGKLARAWFESEVGREAEPAVSVVFPDRRGVGRLEAYVLDARRQLCYCRVGADRTPIAVKTETYKALANELAKLGRGSMGALALPFHVAIGDELKARLDRLERPLRVTTVAANPNDLLLDLANQPELATTLQTDRPDPRSLSAAVALPPYAAMARALAESMARASEQVTVRHLDVGEGAEAVKEFAKSLQRAVRELDDVLVLQYGERVRVLRGDALVVREQVGPLTTSAPRFEGDAVVARALDGLLAERGRVYIATGHDERRMDDTLRAGLSRTVAQLQARGFRVEPLDLAAAQAMPDDCRVLILAGPRKPFEPAAEALLERYLDGGGRLAVLLDPPKQTAVLERLLARYGIAAARPERKLAAVQLELNRGLDVAKGWTREPTVLLTAVALSVTAPQAAALRGECLARAFDEQPGGEADCLIAATWPKEGGEGPKLLVAGDVDAFTNQSLDGIPGRFLGKPRKLFQLPGNIELLVQMVTWLAE